MDLPKISIVTPSYNQVEFIEYTINSVLSQNYPNLEYIIVDGGSTDGTVEIIKKYEKHLAWWVSEPDQGQYPAINKGFSRSTGEVMAWINSDDKYCPWSLRIVGEIFAGHPDIRWVTSLFPMLWSAGGAPAACFERPGYSAKAFEEGRYTDFTRSNNLGYIQQESTFWRRTLWDDAGSSLDCSFDLAADFELWSRFFGHAKLYGVAVPIAGFRVHENQRSQQKFKYRKECKRVLCKKSLSWLSLMRTAFGFTGLQHARFVGKLLNRLLGYDFYKVEYDVLGDNGWKVVKQRRVV